MAILVDDVCRSIRLDAAVVYSGNNEFLELHSRRFAELRGETPGTVARALAGSRLLGVLTGAGDEPSPEQLEASITTRNLAASDSRVTHSEMLREVRLTDEEHEGVLDLYEQNLRTMCASAREAGVPMFLCTVARTKGGHPNRAGLRRSTLCADRWCR